MRYPRNVKIFRGGIDAAPFAGLFFVLVLVMMLFHTHVFFPGVPIELAEEMEEPEIGSRGVRVLRSGELQFLGENISLEQLPEELQRRAQRGTLPKRVILDAQRGADARTVEKVELALSGAGIAIKLPGARLELPEDAGFAGAANPIVVVAVNLNGQFFFQHQRVSREMLEEELAAAVKRTDAPLTLLLQADRKVPHERIIELSRLARRAGIARVYLATRPGLS